MNLVIITFCVVTIFIVHYRVYNKNNNPIIPEQGSFKYLKKGNRQFRRDFKRTDTPGYIETQKPHTAILSCSDSRTPVERIFNLSKGEIFVIREAGQVMAFNSIASLEYAVAVVGVNRLIILGHTECGAVHAAMSGNKLPSEALTKLVNNIKGHIRPNDTLDQAIHHHTEALVIELLKESSIIKEAVTGKSVKIFSGIYNIQTGKVKLSQYKF
jgi:carbonic anhydrase